MESNETLKIGVSITEMSEMLGFSRSRCYQLIEAGILYPPIFDTQTHRPFFPPEIQAKNLEIRKRNCGMNGKPILFYARRFTTEPIIKKLPTRKAKSQTRKDPIVERLISDLKSLGIESLNPVHIVSALKICFPAGINQVAEPEVLRSVYRYLKRQNTNDNVER
jgi:predicted DNA-binding transcriptional regulator AlpA